MSLSIIQVDAFTDRPFAGNPAAVCVLPEPADAGWMQNVAREMNLSETAFLHREGDGFRLRWFTPTVEMVLCGHATLAGAHVLWQERHLPPDETARFNTLSGLLTARRDGSWIEMDFPADPPEPVEPPAELIESLGVTPVWVGKNSIFHLVEVGSEAEVRSVRPNFSLLATVAIPVGVIVTSVADTEEFDFVSRIFAPQVGIDEDPVTGGAHCCLGPYWQERLGKSELLAYQASARGGVIGVRVTGDRVALRGQAVTVLRGELVDGASH